MPLTKLRPSPSPLLTDERLAQLRAILPEAFADGKINWDTLREILGEHLEDDAQEHFGLFWPGKREARRLASLPSKGTLIPQPGQGVDEDTTHNLFIEGDNLEVLKLLQKSYAGRVKLIYIDPPYNTGNDFIYSDDFVDPLKDYLGKTGQLDEKGQVLTSNTKTGGRYHSNWLNMIYPRLLLAKKLLSEDGSIFISIDDNEVHNLRQVMNEIFGEENFITTVIWQKVYSPKNTAKFFSEDHDYIVVYSKNVDVWVPNLLPRTDDANARYTNLDNDPRGPWKPSDTTARNYYGAGQYEVTSPSGKKFHPGMGLYWRLSYENFLAFDKDNRIWWGPNGDNMPALKRFLSEVKNGIVPQTLWTYKDVGHTQDAKKQLLEFVHFEKTENVLNTLKPTKLLKRILAIGTTPTDNDLVLDFFSGSASLAHAVLEQNEEDGGNRKFIVVQFPEPLPIPEKKLKTIADIGKERIRNFISTTKDDKKGKLELVPKTDLGFKCFVLKTTHFTEWQPTTERDTSQLELRFTQAESPLVPGWTPENLLTEILLLQGFPLDSRVRPLAEFQSNRVLEVTSEFCQHRLYVCLDEKIQPETVQAFQLRPEDILVALDSALSDEAKIRLADQVNLQVI